MLEKAIFQIKNKQEFETLALQVFQYQYEHVAPYRDFCNLLHKNPDNVTSLKSIPFLPIEFFKSHTILSDQKESQTIFTSSGTTGMVTSNHFVADLPLYEQSFLRGFQQFYGNPKDWTILALLPSYLEREGSSLIYMVQSLIETSNASSGFYLHNLDALIENLEALEKSNQKTLLIGVSYALLDLIEKQQFQLKSTTIMETGGMKGKRKELIKAALHEKLKKGFGVAQIHSEYGMTELLSQAYSSGKGVYTTPPWMKVFTRDTEDALTFVSGKTGGINVIDLANLYSCSFIATQDLGKTLPDGSFEILGRFDTSDIRGCNLMVL
ncbi:acyl transferase [Aureisphaera sp. CAU 1614]|uniref:Acyl transferase n=1 Tax=Halomarinibacterium sedimenti TaxID=2857106 RepID=A0A9X1JZ81_9FLAO|nr:acyl transferase [Halomarinibacterium sedimenti]MBW2936991.1 acyl transferase [Halomarinibacterium sedimenti]